MNIQKKIVMTFGGAVLAACLTVGGLAAANAATVPPTQPAAATQTTSTVIADASPAPSGATSAAQASTQPSTSATAPSTYPLNGDWATFVATRTRAQQESLLVGEKARLAAVKQVGVQPAVNQLTSNIEILEKALGE